MFDRYTEKARRVVFFAKHEATVLGSPYIETEHLLLGILREDTTLADQFFPSNASVDSIRKQVETNSTRRKRVPENADRPLSDEAKSSLAYATEEADRLGDKHIGTEHLFLGVLRTEKSFAAKLLNDLGVEIVPVIEPPPPPARAANPSANVAATKAAVPATNGAPKPAPSANGAASKASPPPPSAPAASAARATPAPGPEPARPQAAPAPAPVPAPIAPAPVVPISVVPVPVPAPVAIQPTTPPLGMFRDLTLAAKEGELDLIVGRDLEIDILIEVLSGTGRRNPILVGHHGTGKTGIVEGLAQRIAAGQAPADLANKHVVQVDAEFLATWSEDRQRFDEFIHLLSAIAPPDQTILFVDCFLKLPLSKPRDRAHDFSGFLQWTLTQPGLRCIAIAEDKEFPLASVTSPWLVEDFREIRVRPLSEEATLVALQNKKPALEKAHGVTYSEECLETAMRSATRDLSGAFLPRTAIELLDIAGTMIKLRRGKPPVEFLELQKKIASLAAQQKTAMKNREFDKARVLADEERKDQEALKALQKKPKAKTTGPETVTSEDIKAVIARLSAYPYSQ
jgi:ATP-dependent Clp protease ATP-binding subunit ClpA